MRILPSRAALAVVVGAFILGSCGGGGGSASLPASVAPSIATPSVAAPRSVRHKHQRDPRDASVCTTMPVNGLQVTTTSMTLAPNASSQFTACTQYASKYAITVSPSGILTAPKNNSSVTAKVQPTTIKTATITVTAGATCRSATITVKDKKGKTQTVSVRVLCSQTFTFTAPGGAQTFTVPTGVTQITVDAVGASGGKGCSNGVYRGAGGSGFELKASGITVISGQTLYVYVGGSPVASADLSCAIPGFPGGVAHYDAAGFNGGGTAYGISYAGFYGGGGGGASDVRTNSNDLTTRLLVAGGGGGGASPAAANPPAGGNGGYPNGAAGSYRFDGTDPTSAFAGQGGTDMSGGAGGQLPNGSFLGSCSGSPGALGIGGSINTQTACWIGGAGGGGYYGGGSGATYDTGLGTDGQSGGGGGSSFVQNGATVVTQQVATPGQCDTNNNGCITISY